MIRRVKRTDAKNVSAFLRKVFAEDSASGGDPAIQTEDAVAARCEVADVWVCIEGGKVVGVLQGFRGGHIEIGGKPYTFNYFNLLAVDYLLYTTSRSEAIRVARELNKGAADDLRDNGGMADLIVVEGPTGSRGASWCRLLRMSEDFKGDWSWFILPFKTIWDRLTETVDLPVPPVETL